VIFRCTPQWFVPMDKPIVRGVSTSLDTNGVGELDQKQDPFASSEVEKPLRTRAPDRHGRDERFVPEKGRNRIGSMVEGRPDWVLSRQRAWGVPITLFVDRKSGQYLVDHAVNARIVAAVKEQGRRCLDARDGAQLPRRRLQRRRL
jgi:isoleucyl-tRNA synthetase